MHGSLRILSCHKFQSAESSGLSPQWTWTPRRRPEGHSRQTPKPPSRPLLYATFKAETELDNIRTTAKHESQPRAVNFEVLCPAAAMRARMDPKGPPFCSFSIRGVRAVWDSSPTHAKVNFATGVNVKSIGMGPKIVIYLKESVSWL